MEKIRFYNTSEVYSGSASLNGNILVIKFDTVPNSEDLTKGIELLNEHNDEVQGDYIDYTTVYRTYPDDELTIEFSNDGSVYVEPIPPIPIVTFLVNYGGTLEGTTTQETSTYDDLVIPTPVANENYEFVEWIPEIPETGEIKGNITFTASFRYVQPLSELKVQKRNEVSAVCNATITGGFDVELSDGVEHFSLKTEDQLNLFGKQAQISQDVAMLSEEKGYEYHQDGELCKYYSLQDMLKIIETAMAYKSYHTTYCNSLFKYIEQLQDKETVNSIYYGIEIPEEYQSEVLKDYIAVMNVQNNEETVVEKQ